MLIVKFIIVIASPLFFIMVLFPDIFIIFPWKLMIITGIIFLGISTFFFCVHTVYFFTKTKDVKKKGLTENISVNLIFIGCIIFFAYYTFMYILIFFSKPDSFQGTCLLLIDRHGFYTSTGSRDYLVSGNYIPPYANSKPSDNDIESIFTSRVKVRIGQSAKNLLITSTTNVQKYNRNFDYVVCPNEVKIEYININFPFFSINNLTKLKIIP